MRKEIHSACLLDLKDTLNVKKKVFVYKKTQSLTEGGLKCPNSPPFLPLFLSPKSSSALACETQVSPTVLCCLATVPAGRHLDWLPLIQEVLGWCPPFCAPGCILLHTASDHTCITVSHVERRAPGSSQTLSLIGDLSHLTSPYSQWQLLTFIMFVGQYYVSWS